VILTDAPHLAEKLRDVRDYDKKPDYRFRWNANMTDLAAAMACEQMKKLPEMIRRRREIASLYGAALEASGLGVRLPAGDEERDHVYYRYVVRPAPDPARWLCGLQAAGVDAKRPVFKPLHAYFNLSDRAFPAAAAAAEQACSIPIFPSMTAEEQGFVASLLEKSAMFAEQAPARSASGGTGVPR
jgi:dTDP-4-amino-4,6-dideoxygalactose transaminase